MSDLNVSPSAGADPVVDNASAVPDAPASLDSAVDSLLAPSGDEGAGEAVEDEQVGDPAEQNEQVEEDPAADGEAPEGEAQAEEDIDPESDEDIDKGLAEGKSNPLDLNSSRGKRIYQSYKAYKEISEKLGRELTVDDAEQHYGAYTDKMAMEHEFSSGDPAQAANWLQNWNGVNPEGMRTVASQMPDLMAQQNPAAYEAMAVPVLNRYINALYQRAGSEQNPEVKKALQYAARVTEWDLHGKYRNDQELEQRVDPLAEREQQLDQKLSQIKTFEQRQAAAQRDQWLNGLDSTNNSALSTEADKALAPIKSAYPARIFNALREDFTRDVKAHMAKDVEGNRIYNIRKQQAQSRLSSEDQQTLAGLYAQSVSRAVRAVLPGFLKEAGVSAKASSTARQKALEQAANAGKAPNSAGAPRPQSIVPNKKQYASRAEAMESSIDQLLGTGKP